MATSQRQDRFLATCWNDGYKCARKGLGLKSDGRFDNDQIARLFGYVCRNFNMNRVDREWGWDAWMDGFHEAVYEMNRQRAEGGFVPWTEIAV